MTKFLLPVLLVLTSCGPQPDYIDSVTKWGKGAGGRASESDDNTGKEANNLRKYLSDRGISGEQLQTVALMAAEDLREYFYTRGVCEMRHGDNCKGKPKDGIDGRDGVDGVAGSNGQDGQPGIPGNNGAVGPQGNDGATGDTGDQGPAGINGQDGSNGIDGVNGNDGLNGSDGINGSNGADGQSCNLVQTFKYSIGHGNGKKCYFDFSVVCGADSVVVAENKKDICQN